jgi:hypothetical protein
LFKELGQVSGWIFIMGPKAAKHYKQVKWYGKKYL